MRAALSLSPRTLVPSLSFLLLCSLTGCHWISGQSANRVGQVYYNFGNYTAAADEFRRAAIDDPSNADYFHNLAAARKKQGRTAAAERSYRQALHINPGHQPSYHGLASVLKQQNRTPEAIALMQSWIGSEPYRTAPYVELAWLQRDSGDLAGATKTLQRAMRVQPNNPTVLAHLGQIYQDTGQRATATAMYQRSLYSNWYQPKVHSRLAALRERRSVPATRFAYGAPYFSGPVSSVVVSPIPAGGIIVNGPRANTAFNADPAHVPEKPTVSANRDGKKQ